MHPCPTCVYMHIHRLIFLCAPQSKHHRDFSICLPALNVYVCIHVHGLIFSCAPQSKHNRDVSIYLPAVSYVYVYSYTDSFFRVHLSLNTTEMSAYASLPYTATLAELLTDSSDARNPGVLQWVAVWCSVVQYVAVCCSVLQCCVVWCNVVQCIVVWCNVVQCIAVSCSVLQCVDCSRTPLMPRCVADCVTACCSVLQSVDS